MPPKKGNLSGSRRPQSFPSGERNVADPLPPLVTHEQLHRENEDLRRQLDETKNMMSQLFHEQSRESYDIRRVMLLKAQLYQTERQLLLLQDGMARRTASLWEVENVLTNVKSQFQSLATVDSATSSPQVTIPRAQLFRLIEDVEKARSALFRRLQRDGGEEKFDQLIPNQFSSSPSTDGSLNGEDAASVIDVLTGAKPLLNLKKVAAMESEIFACYGEVRKLCTELAIIASVGSNDPSVNNENNQDQDGGEAKVDFAPSIHYSPTVIAKLRKAAEKSRQSLECLGSKLMEVSLLVPLSHHPPSRPSRSASDSTAAWHHRNSLIDAKTLLQKFPRQTIAKSRLKEVTSVLESYVRICDSQRLVDQDHIRYLREELENLAQLLQIQNDFVSDVISLTEKSYMDFYLELSSNFSCPLAVISSTFQNLEADPSEDNLRLFLLAVRENHGALTSLQRYLKQQEQPPTAQFEMVQHSFREKMNHGLQKLALKRESDIADNAQKTSDLRELRDTFCQIAVTTP